MDILLELNNIVNELALKITIPKIKDIYLPPIFDDGQPVEHEFMIITLEGNAAGLSYVLIPNDLKDSYRSLETNHFIGTRPMEHIDFSDNENAVKNMIGLAAVNAICQHIMRLENIELDLATDSIGLIDIKDGDIIGMVGFFRPLLKYAEKSDIELVIIEKNEALIEKYPDLNITLDAAELNRCNKVLCTSTTILNNTIDNILSHCSGAEHITILGPTAGFLPDPLFARGVDVVGSRYVKDGDLLLKRIKNGERWGDATEKLCFQKKNYKNFYKS